MSLICSELDNAQPSNGTMPCQDDIAIQMLKKVFGDTFIESFYVPGTKHPALAAPSGSGDTIMSLIASNLSYAAFLVAILILIFSIYKGLISGASDGVAVAFSDKSNLMGLFGRPLFSLAMLLPTLSGFPVIYLLIIFITLTSNGLANMGFSKYIEVDYKPSGAVARLDDTSYLAANDMLKPAFYGALHGYCVSYANNVLHADMRMIRKDSWDVSVTTGTASYGNRDEAIQRAQNTWGSAFGRGGTYVHRYTLEYMDRSGPSTTIGYLWGKYGLGTLGVPGDICGKFESKPSTVRYLTGESENPTDIKGISNSITNDIRSLGYAISEERIRYAQAAYFDAFAMANKGTGGGTRLPILDSEANANGNEAVGAEAFCQAAGCGKAELHGPNGWVFDSEEYAGGPADNLVPNIQNIIRIADYYNSQLNLSLKTIMLQRGYGYTEVDGSITAPQGVTDAANKMSLIVNATVKQGWMAAGTYRARVQKFKNSLRNSLYASPVDVSFSNIDPDDEEGEISTFVQNLNEVKTALYGQLAESAQVPYYSPLKTEASVAQFDIRSKNPDLIMSGLAASFTQSVLDTERNLITYLTGSGANDNVDALSRIQEVGETIAGLSLALATLHKVVMSVLAALSMTLGAAGAGSVGMFYSFDVAIKAVASMYIETIGTWAQMAVDSLFEISRIFSVVIPTMPYVFLALAAVGWLMQIIQTATGMPLFFIMHAIPEKSFVGSQAQGWVTLVSLFFRPIIILAAFFLAFVMYDPVVTYVTNAYFSIHEEISGASTDNDAARFFIVMSTFKYYWFVYGGILMAVTYLIFGLVQELGDSVLDWLGTNLLRGFGNLDTGGVMKGASAGMGQFAGKMNSTRSNIRNQQNQQRMAAAQQQGGGAGGAGGGGAGAGTGGGGGGAGTGGGGVAAGANQPASVGRSSIGGTGPAPFSAAQDTGLNSPGRLGAATLVTAGAATTGAVIGAGQGFVAGGRRAEGFANRTVGRLPLPGVVRNTLVGGVATLGATGGAIGGAAAGAAGGIRRGAASVAGRSAYRNVKHAQAGKGAWGIWGRTTQQQRTASAQAMGGAMSRVNTNVMTDGHLTSMAGQAGAVNRSPGNMAKMKFNAITTPAPHPNRVMAKFRRKVNQPVMSAGMANMNQTTPRGFRSMGL